MSITECEIDNRWLPPSPHKEKVLEFIRRGRAHIEERGHGIPPLIAFEDGGVMELPRVRLTTDGNFTPAGEGEPAIRQTYYSDVCGTIDELKRLLKEKPELSARLFELLDDACYMISRMQRRREHYEQFAVRAGSVYESLKQVGGPDPEGAYQKADQMRAFLRENPEQLGGKLDELYQIAEGIRSVASNLEHTLSDYRDLAVELGRLYAELKGSRNWEKSKEAEQG